MWKMLVLGRTVTPLLPPPLPPPRHLYRPLPLLSLTLNRRAMGTSPSPGPVDLVLSPPVTAATVTISTPQ